MFTDFEVYSGYLSLPDSETKQFHYLLATSQNSPSTDPFIVWFNGGPGCSSLLGWAQEHGPYIIPDYETTFTLNPYSWNKEANVLYLESPGGVGFSTCFATLECTSSDASSAVDNLNALLNFFTVKFPEFAQNDLYISGESYAGIYVPLLVD